MSPSSGGTGPSLHVGEAEGVRGIVYWLFFGDQIGYGFKSNRIQKGERKWLQR